MITPAGIRVPVTTSGETSVSLSHASLSQLRTGETTVAVGRAGLGRVLAAITVLQPVFGGGRVNWQVKGCSPVSVGTALTAAVIAGG